MSLDLDPEQAERRVQALLDDTDTLLSLVPTGGSKAAAYYLAVVEREHPDEADAVVLMERYAQLAAEWSDMSDTWLKNGINRRAPGDGTLARALAQAYAGVSAQQDAGSVGSREVNHVDPSED